MKLASRLNNVSEYYFAGKLAEIAEMNKTGDTVINLGIGSPDLPPHESVIKALTESAQRLDVHGYQSYRGIDKLRQAFADFYSRIYGVQLDYTSELLPLMGSKEGIVHISMTYLEKGDKVLIPNPGYPAYSAAAKLAGAEVIEYGLTEKNDWLPDTDELEAMNLSGVKLMWINYPNMPTGKAGDKELFESLVRFASVHNILLCHDNPYSMILNESPLSIFSINGAKDYAIELNSLSKSFNLAGWRVGALAGKKDHIDNVLRFKSNLDSGMFFAVQYAAAKALELPDAWFEDLNRVYASRKEAGLKLLNKLGCKVTGKQAGFFLWARIPENGLNSYLFSDKVLKNHRVFLTPGGIFGSEGDSYIRLSLCSPQDKLEKAVERVTG